MELNLRGRKAIVTGASRGIGLAIATQLVDEGCSVAICARGLEGLLAQAETLRTRGVDVFARAVDVADGDTFGGFIAEAAEHLGGVDIFVSNTSGGGGLGGESGFRQNFEVDVLGAVRGVESCLPYLEVSEAASVIFISTTAAVETFLNPAGYGPMKAALLNYSNALSQHYASKQIRFNSVSPGPIYFAGGPWARIETAVPSLFEATLKQLPMGRFGSPEDVARAVAFLASPAASYVTGVNLIIDGGFTKRVNF